MSTEIKASLEKYIDDWIESNAEDESWNWANYWYDERLAERMAEAAYAVFMAAREAQAFAKAREKA